MRLHLGGHLGWYDSQKRKWIEVHLAQPTQLVDVLTNFGVPLGEIAAGTLNGQTLLSIDDVIVNDADTVELFPPVGGG